ncbi:hypothetical protein [Denitromonas halophila]|uniref:Uncharacterized protein n=1 Tax=Denitromonas halophila TaxID=1629404 RepID=A0A557QLQ6_9RHOO|nr:hypothetical protein [Denitromonas halophila]TVO53824.1 hypothetical protein FHP91_13585 [Denitromonas halophila]
MSLAKLKLIFLNRRLKAAERDRHTVALRAAEELHQRDGYIHRLRRKLASAEASQNTASSAAIVSRIERNAKGIAPHQ